MNIKDIHTTREITSQEPDTKTRQILNYVTRGLGRYFKETRGKNQLDKKQVALWDSIVLFLY